MANAKTTPQSFSTQVEFFSTSTAAFHIIRGDIQFREERVLESYIERALQVQVCDVYYKAHRNELAAQGIKAAEFKERCGVQASEKSSWSQDVKIAKAHTPEKFEEFQDLCNMGAFRFLRKDYMEFLGLIAKKSEQEDRTGQVYFKIGNDDKGVWIVLAEQPKSFQNAMAKFQDAQAA